MYELDEEAKKNWPLTNNSQDTLVLRQIKMYLARIEKLENENIELRDTLIKFRAWGTDGCPKCGVGRITLFHKEDLCMKCNERNEDDRKPNLPTARK